MFSLKVNHWFSRNQVFVFYEYRISMEIHPSKSLLSIDRIDVKCKTRLLEFTFRLGTTNSQCYGTNPTDLDRNLKSILLLTSCSNGIHWKIIDRFHISDILAPDYGFK